MDGRWSVASAGEVTVVTPLRRNDGWDGGWAMVRRGGERAGAGLANPTRGRTRPEPHKAGRGAGRRGEGRAGTRSRGAERDRRGMGAGVGGGAGDLKIPGTGTAAVAGLAGWR